MPFKPPSPCAHPGCPEVCHTRYCDKHTAEHANQRGSSTQQGYGARWRRARLAWLSEHPLCVMCLAEGRVVAANTVDHITPHKGDTEKFWRQNNWQSLCSSCHSRKTASEDGAFGNKQG